MDGITIDLNKAHRGLERCEGRRLSFPDGIDRIAILPRRKWAMYDELLHHWVYPGLYEGSVFEDAHRYGMPGEPDFERVLIKFFSIAIEVGWSLLNEDWRGPANENSAALTKANGPGPVDCS